MKETRAIYFLIMFLICCFTIGCNTNENTIEKTWIGKYIGYYSDSTDYNRPLNIILEFKKDSLKINDFEFRFGAAKPDDYFGLYKLDNKKLITTVDTIQIDTLVSDSLIFVEYHGEKMKKVFVPLSTYNQANREAEFLEFLTSNTFTNRKSEQIEFRSDRKYFERNLKYNKPNKYWTTYIHQNELFLLFESSVATQIIDFDSTQIKGKFHHHKDKDVLFKKINSVSEFNTSQITGNWQRIMDARPDPPIMGGEFYQKEILKITPDTILRFEGHRRDTITWQFNRDQNSIILNSDYKVKERLGDHWNIVSIEKNILTLERRIESPTLLYNKVIVHRFNKIN